MGGVAVLEKPESWHIKGLLEPAGVREEMLELGVQFEDASLAERLKPAIQSALSCKATCVVNPINTIYKIRQAFYNLSSDGEITADESTKAVARLMSVTGDVYEKRQALVNQLKAGNLSVLKLPA